MAHQKEGYEYFAFISYKREDEKWAKWLQRKLEYYKMPSSIRKDHPDVPEKIRPVFKDTTDLEPGVLAKKIQEALDSSKFLIVICSPRSANSIWVSKEVQSFIDSGRADHIIPFIIGGTPNAIDPKDECFPEGLRQLAGEKELLGANINEMGRDAAAIKVVARMFGLRFDSLWQRHQKEESRRKWILGIGGLLLITFLVVVALIIYNKNIQLDGLNVDLINQKKSLAVANDSILAEQARIRKGAVQQSLYLAESKIREGDIGYALTLMTLVKDHESMIKGDNKVCHRYNEVLRLLADSMSRSHIKLIDIVDSSKDSVRASKFKDFSSVIWEVNHYKEYQKPDYFRYNQNGVITNDSVLAYSRVNNRDMTITALYDGDGDDEHDGIANYTSGKNGIFILNNETGELIRFISAWGWYPWQCYPIAMDNSGTKLIYRTGGREYDYVRIYDFAKGVFQFIDKAEGGYAYRHSTDDINGAFNIGDNMFALHYSEKDETDSSHSVIKIYKTGHTRPFLTLSFPDCQGIFWDEKNYLNIRCKDSTYIFDIGKESHFSEISFQQSIDEIALSPVNNELAVLTPNKTVHIIDKKGKNLKLKRALSGSPDKMEFSPIDNTLWVTDGYDNVSVIDIPSGRVKVIDYECLYPPHHWEHDITFIDGGKRCLTFFHYGSRYRLFNTAKKQFVEDYREDEKTNNPRITLNLSPIDSVDLHEGAVTALKVTEDKKHILRGYGSGKVVISDYDTYTRLFNRLGISYVLEDK